jgi:hypothetical protein
MKVSVCGLPAGASRFLMSPGTCGTPDRRSGRQNAAFRHPAYRTSRGLPGSLVLQPASGVLPEPQMLMLEHIGRTSGQRRQMVLEMVDMNEVHCSQVRCGSGPARQHPRRRASRLAPVSAGRHTDQVGERLICPADMCAPLASASTSSGCAYSRSVRSRTRRSRARSGRCCTAAGVPVTREIGHSRDVPRRNL